MSKDDVPADLLPPPRTGSSSSTNNNSVGGLPQFETSEIVTFRFAVSASYVPQDHNLHVVIRENSMNFPSDFETLCLNRNLYGNTNISNVSCKYFEQCGQNCYCSGSSINRTCQNTSLSGSACQGVNVQWKNCKQGCLTSPTKEAWWQCTCYRPDPKFYYPDPRTEPIYIGKEGNNYVFEVSYEATHFRTPSDLSKLVRVVTDNDTNCNQNDRARNQENLNKVRQSVCNKGDLSALSSSACASYCRIDSPPVGLPGSNCASGWTSLCQSSDVHFLSNENCRDWCVTVNGQSHCKAKIMDYCDNAPTFQSSVCTDFYRNSYQNNQITSDASDILYGQCATYVNPTTSEVQMDYPSDICGCFLPDRVYDTFYQRIYADNPSFTGVLSNPQCTYPDCASTSAIHPRVNFTCPDNVLTTCIANLEAGNITNSQINIANACVASSTNMSADSQINASDASSSASDASSFADVSFPPMMPSSGPESSPPAARKAVQPPTWVIGLVVASGVLFILATGIWLLGREKSKKVSEKL